jgi:hypothetical protein
MSNLSHTTEEISMTKIIPFLQGEAFGPDALRAMSTALGEICRMLKVDHDQGAREVMAVRIIELARRGECDPERLRDRVLREAGATSSVVESAVAAAPVDISNGAAANMASDVRQ